VWIPLIRFGGDHSPIAWWEWLFAPLVWAITIPLLLVAALLSIPYYMVYPDHHAHEWDFGTKEQQEIMRRYRRFAARVSFWRRCGRLLASPFRRVRRRRTVFMVNRLEE
jgi:hypothetical protein